MHSSTGILNVNHLKSWLAFLLILFATIASRADYVITGATANGTSAAQVLCLNSSFSDLTAQFNVNTCGTGTTVRTVRVTWYYNTTNSNATGTATQVARFTTQSVGTASTVQFTLSALTYLGTANFTSARYYFCVIDSHSPTSACTGMNNGAASATIRLQGTSAPILGTPTWSANPNSVCTGTGTTYTLTPMLGPSVSYSWSYSGTGATISGATTTNSVTVTFAQGATTGNLQVTGTGCSGSTSTSVSVTTINNPPSITTQPSSTARETCNGTAFVNGITVSASSSFTWQWYFNSTPTTTGGTLATGTNNSGSATVAGGTATSSSYIPPNGTNGTRYYYCILTSNSCTTTSNYATYTVSQAPSGLTGPSATNRTVCQDIAFPTLTVAPTGTSSNVSYQWYSNTANSATGGTLITGETSASYTPPSNVVNVRYYYASASAGSCATIRTSTVSGSHTVNANTAITAQNNTANQTNCSGTSFSAMSVTTSGTSLSYNWYSNSTASTSGGSQVATSTTYTPPSTAVGTTYYYVTVTGSCGSAVTSSISGAYSVTSRPTLTGATQDSIVSNGPVKVNLSGLTPNKSFSIVFALSGTTASPNTVNLNSNASGNASFNVNNATGLTYLNNYTQLSFTSVTNVTDAPNCTVASTPTTRLYLAKTKSAKSGNWATAATWSNGIPGADDGGCNSGASADAGTCLGVGTATSSVAPVFVGHNLTIDQNISIGMGVYYFGAKAVGIKTNSQIIDAPGGTAYNIDINYPGGTPSASNAILDIQSGTTKIEGTLTVRDGTLYIRNGATLIVGACVNPTTTTCNAMTITSDARILIEAGGSLIVNGDLLNDNQDTGNIQVDGYLYVAGDYTSLVNGTNNPVNVTGTGQFNAGGQITTGGTSTVFGSQNNCTSGPCSGNALTCGTGSYTNQITANSQSVTTVNSCSAATVLFSFSTNAPMGTYQWQSSTTSASTGFTDITGQTATSYSAAPATTSYYRMAYTPSGCGVSYSSVVTVNTTAGPTITAQPAASTTVCQNGTAPTFSVSATPATGTIQSYRWYVTSNPTTPLITNTTSATTNSYSGASTANSGSFTYYAVVTESTGCTTTSSNAVLNITAGPVATFGGTATICPGNSANLSATVTGSVGPFNLTYRDNVSNLSTVINNYSSGDPITVSPASTRSFTLTALAAGSCPASTLSGTPTITVSAGPSASILNSDYPGNNGTVCSGSNASVKVNITGGVAPFTVVISNGATNTTNGSYTSGANLSLPAPNAVTYSLVSVSDANGCPGSGNSGTVSVSLTNQTSWQGAASGGDWATSNNWTCGVPSASFDAVIAAGNVVGVSTATNVRNLTVNGSLVFNAGVTMTIYGDLSSNGPTYTPASGFPGCVTFLPNATPKLSFAGNGSQTISGTSTIVLNDLEIANTSGTVSNEATLLDVYGVVTMPLSTSVFDADGNSNTSVLRLRSTSATQAASIGVLNYPNNLTGLVTVQRHIGVPLANKYRYVSVPLTGITLGTDLSEWNIKGVVYYYNEPTSGVFSNGWVRIPTTYSFGSAQRGRGFQSWNTPGLWDARGTVNTGEIQMPVSYTFSNNPDADGWNCIGNPYPSAIQWNNTDWVMSNIGSTIYVPDNAANVWRTWNLVGSGSGDLAGGIIAMGQGFWVYATAANPVLTAKESAKRSTSGAYYRQMNQNLPSLEISWTGNGVTDRAFIGIHPDATAGYDPSLDGLKLSGEELSVSTVSSDNRLMVHDFMDRMDREIPIKLVATSAGDYSLTISSAQFEQWGDLYLIDKGRGESFQLESGKSINIKIANRLTGSENRFYLSKTRPRLLDKTVHLSVHPNPAADVVTIQVNSDHQVPAQLISMAGQKLLQTELTAEDGIATGKMDISQLPSGIYLLEVNTGMGTKTEKIIKR